MKKKLQFSVTNYQVCLWPLCMLVEMLLWHFHKVYRVRYQGWQIGEWQNRTNRFALKREMYNRVARQILSRLDKNPRWIWTMTKKIAPASRQLVAFSSKIWRARLSQMTDMQIYQWYEKYHREFIKMYTYAWLPNSLEGLDSLFTKKLESYLRQRVGAEKVGKYLSVLTTPLKDTTRQQEEKEFLKIFSGGLRAIKRHCQRYCFIPFDYDGPAWDLEYFLDRARSLKKQGINPAKKLADLKKERVRIKKLQQQYARLAGLDKNKPYAFYFKLARELMYLKDYRKDALFKSYYHLDKLMREIGRRLGLTAIQVKHILPQEMAAALLRRKYDVNELNQRIQYSALVFRGSSIKIYSGPKARAIVKKYVRSEETPKGIKELRGEPAYPGKAQGRVCFVFETKDIIKMKSGDILVSVATNPNLIPAMKKAGAIVTDKGGITSHAAIISRELKIPCVTGTQIATQVFKDGDRVEVDAEKGVVRITKRAGQSTR